VTNPYTCQNLLRAGGGVHVAERPRAPGSGGLTSIVT
jgi:hypothetical protein